MIEIFAVGLLALTGACLGVQAAWARYLRAGPAGAAERDPAVYELAYLAGGPPRVATTVLSVLSHCGLVAITPDGRVSASREGTAADPVEADIVTMLRSRPSPVPASKVFASVARSKALATLAARLARQRLLVPLGRHTPSWVGGTAGLAALAAAANAVVAALGGAAWPTAVSATAVACGAAAALRSRRGLAAEPTEAGRRVLVAAYTRYRRGETRPGSGSQSILARRVALEGASALADPQAQQVLAHAEKAAVDGSPRRWRWKPREDSSRDADSWPRDPRASQSGTGYRL